MTTQVESFRAKARKRIRDFVLLPMAAGAALLCVVPGAAVAEERWLCVAESVVGFGYQDKGGWQPRGFEPKAKLVIARPRKEDGFAPGAVAWVARVLNSSAAPHACEDFGSSSQLECYSFNGGQLRFSKHHLRYWRVSMRPYWTNVDPLSNGQEGRPFLEIGSCSAF